MTLDVGSFACPKCGGGTGVKDSRPNDARSAIRRRRLCAACGNRFTTFEMTVSDGFSPQGLRELVTATRTSLDKVGVAVGDAREQLANIEKVQEIMYGAKNG